MAEHQIDAVVVVRERRNFYDGRRCRVVESWSADRPDSSAPTVYKLQVEGLNVCFLTTADRFEAVAE